MLEGIEILNKSEIMMEQSIGNPTLIAITSIITVTIMVILLLFGLSICIKKWVDYVVDKINIFMGAVIFLGVTAIVSALICSITKNTTISVPSGKYEYQVTIDENVSMTKFYEKYEVVEVNGKIYTIIEKE